MSNNKNEEDKFFEQIADDLTFAGTNMAQNIIYNYYDIAGPPDGIARSLFYALMRLIYDALPQRCLNIIDYPPLDKFLFFLGPQLVFTSMYTRNNRAIISDLINLTINFTKDYVIAEGA